MDVKNYNKHSDALNQVWTPLNYHPMPSGEDAPKNMKDLYDFAQENPLCGVPYVEGEDVMDKPNREEDFKLDIRLDTPKINMNSVRVIEDAKRNLLGR